ncbi:MAG: 15-cis-phytoene synthase [Solirubrobacteraceae bacterium]|nr:15-cis-phytoene synthase [Solirubrobacteraceae bacterium]
MEEIEETIVRSYERCRRMQRRHDPTFYWATRRLPTHQRPAVHALYGFLRGADEIVDGPGRAPDPAARRHALDAWHAALEHGLAAGRSDHPVLAALVHAGGRLELPLHLLPVYMDSMRVDCDARVRIGSHEELDRYMDGSAATVGRIMAPLLGAPTAVHEDLAALGVAFQLTNFIRDVREDFALDRVYLPGLDEGVMLRREADQRFRERVAREVARARDLFAATHRLEGDLPAAVGPGVRLARAVYERILDRIEALEFDVLGRRTSLPPWQVGAAAARALVR